MREYGPIDVEKKRKNLESRVFLFRKSRNVTVEKVAIKEIPCEWLFPRNCDKGCVIIYLHGGAYVAGSLNTHRGLASHIGIASGSSVILIDYRLAPENPFPAALEDVVTVYKWLVEQKNVNQNRIIIAGDSAGGGLALATLIKLRDEGIDLPAAAVCISPWIDLAITGKSIETKTKEDEMLTKNDLQQSARMYLKDTNCMNPLASPLYADLEGLPPILLQTGTKEILLDDTLRFAEKAKNVGVDVTSDIWSGMWHVFAIFGNLMPESKEALKRIGKFIQEKLF